MYYRRFISGFAEIAKPLTRLAEEKHIQVVHRNRDRFPSTERGIVYSSCPGLPENGRSSSSTPTPAMWGDWWSLSQVQDDSKWVVAYFSKTGLHFQTQIILKNVCVGNISNLGPCLL